MKNKYYTPAIEEFCIGFEFEYYWNEKWERTKLEINDCIYGEYDNHYSFGQIVQNKIKTRVKYFDKEDIESLGFKYTTFRKMNVWTYSDFNLYFNERDELVIWNKNGSIIIFKGTVKNKSEFKIILRQVGIIK